MEDEEFVINVSTLLLLATKISAQLSEKKLITIDVGLEAILSKKNHGDLWTLSESRSLLQHLHKWYIVGNKTIVSILHKPKHISQHHDIHFRWIPSPIELYGNEMVDKLTKKSCILPIPSSSARIYLELYSLEKSKDLAE
ncbi:RNase H domain-containing protein [Trichonephila clavipes]|nr:RNase H domain-containing protein [Trichonephila clavipes]